MTNTSAFCSELEDPIYRDLFCSLYDITSPALPLKEILHWSAVTKSVQLDHLSFQNQKVYVGNGYFYGIHAAIPCNKVLLETEQQALKENCQWVIWPMIRQSDSNLLEASGYYRIPWFYESEFKIAKSVDEDFKFSLGKHTAKNIARLARKAEQEFSLEFHWLRDLDKFDPLPEFDNIHQENLKKYGHQRNTHGSNQLKILCESKLRNNLVVCLRKSLESGVAVQASLNLCCEKEKYFMMLVQGIRRDLVPSYHNLYLAETYQIYKWAESRGIDTFNLGRGAVLTKARLGCNRFFALDIYMKPLEMNLNISQIEELKLATTLMLKSERIKVETALQEGTYEFCERI